MKPSKIDLIQNIHGHTTNCAMIPPKIGSSTGLKHVRKEAIANDFPRSHFPYISAMMGPVSFEEWQQSVDELVEIGLFVLICTAMPLLAPVSVTSLTAIIKAFELPSGQREFHHALQNSHVSFRLVTSENAAATKSPVARPRK